MKTRNGFVSNSSSSSFMIAIALIEDKEKFNKSVKSRDGLEIYKVKDLPKWHTREDRIHVASFMGDVSIPLKKVSPDDEVVIFEYIGDEGDSVFMYDDYAWDYNYDIDLDFFDKTEQDIYNMFSTENGLTNIDKTYGAGRNG